MAISHAAGTAPAAAFTWNTKCQASVASTSRVDNPRPKKAITNAAKTFERSTPVPNSEAANPSPVPRSIGVANATKAGGRPDPRPAGALAQPTPGVRRAHPPRVTFPARELADPGPQNGQQQRLDTQRGDLPQRSRQIATSRRTPDQSRPANGRHEIPEQTPTPSPFLES
jgi:hypothetical protein